MPRYQVDGMVNFSFEYDADVPIPSLQWRMEQRRLLLEKFKEFMEDMETVSFQKTLDLSLRWDSAKLVVDDTQTLLEAIHHAKFYETVPQLIACLERFPDVNQTDEKSITPLMMAAWMGHKALVEALLQRGAHLAARSDGGGTALNVAAGQGNTEVVFTLLQAGADLEEQDAYGMTALLHAAWQNRLETAQALVKQGADIHARDIAGRTAQVYATGSTPPLYVAEHLAGLEASGKMTTEIREHLRKREEEHDRTLLIAYLDSLEEAYAAP